MNRNIIFKDLLILLVVALVNSLVGATFSTIRKRFSDQKKSKGRVIYELPEETQEFYCFIADSWDFHDSQEYTNPNLFDKFGYEIIASDGYRRDYVPKVCRVEMHLNVQQDLDSNPEHIAYPRKDKRFIKGFRVYLQPIF